VSDRAKITALVALVCEKYRETPLSLIIYDSKTKLIFDDDGEIRSVIRDGSSFGPEGRTGHTRGVNLDDGEM